MDQELLQRKLDARQKQGDVDERRRQKHLQVARALRNPFNAPSVIASARQQLQLWRDQKLCSQDYISEWDALLAQPMLAADLLEAHSLKAVRMRQNSPFVSVIRKFQALAHAS